MKTWEVEQREDNFIIQWKKPKSTNDFIAICKKEHHANLISKLPKLIDLLERMCLQLKPSKQLDKFQDEATEILSHGCVQTFRESQD